MSVLDDSSLVMKVKEDACSDSLKELISRHSPLFYRVYKRYFNAMKSTGINLNDVIEDKDSVIYHAARTFKPEKNIKFSSWLGNRARFHCLNAMNKREEYIPIDSEELNYIIDKNVSVSPFNNDFKDYIVTILEQLSDPRIKKIFELRYFEEGKEMSFFKIGKKIGISQQTVINLHEEGKKILKSKLKNCSVFDSI